jgi:hypothetical protein
MIVIVATACAGLFGYAVSSQTGVEPGFFEAAEAGGYGAGPASDGGDAEGIDQELQEYYKSLQTE